MAAIHQQSSEFADPDWLEFESLLGELAEIAKSELPFEQLANLLLDKTVQILGATGGAIWLAARSLPAQLICQANPQVLDGLLNAKFHQQLLDQVRTEGEATTLPPGGNTHGSRSLTNPTAYTLLVAPLKVDDDIAGLFEIVLRPDCGAAAVRGSRRLLGLVCELASDNLRRSELRKLRDDRDRLAKLEEFAERVHGTLDLKSVAYELANAGRQFIDCDRVSVLVRKGRKYRLTAVSSVDSINRRSNIARRLEQLAARAAVAHEPVWYGIGDAENLAPQVVESLQLYADEAHPRSLGLLPLSLPAEDDTGKRAQAIGVLVVEDFNTVLDMSSRDRAVSVGRSSGAALANAIRYESLPTLPWLRRRNAAIGQPAVRPLTVLAALAGILLTGSLFFIPIDFNVRAEGVLQPERQQFVFAPFDGQVASISVKHGDTVEKNAELLRLRSPEIDLESQRLQGEVNTTQQRITAIDSSLLQMDVSNEPDENRYTQLAAEKEELSQVLSSQEQQLELLREQRNRLLVRSPMAGEVLTWDLEQLLSDRPVQRGQSLMSVADLGGPWVAELDVPDDKIGYVLDARAAEKAVPVLFQLATERGVDHRAQLRRIASRTEATDGNGSVVRVTLDVDEQSIQGLRPGATIVADINCGRRSVAYVLFHDLAETIINWLRF